MTRIIGVPLIAGSGLLVAYAEGFHGLAVWNLMPLAAAMASEAAHMERGRLRWRDDTLDCLDTCRMGFRLGRNTDEFIHIWIDLPVFADLLDPAWHGCMGCNKGH
jgi:hypothetical protein